MARYGLLRRAVGRALSLTPRWPTRGDRFHFVRDYRRLVRGLIADYPRDEAMSRAVGGSYEEIGARLAQVMIDTGLGDGMSLLDLECGSGRLAAAVSQRLEIDYLGIDVVPELLGYARMRCPSSYRFEVNRSLGLPAPDAAFDRVCAFSVFTHLLHEESYGYLCEAWRVLKPGGTMAFSFLEFAEDAHWKIFTDTAARLALNKREPLNAFIEASVLALWARRIGFEPPAITRLGDPGAAGTLGQSFAVMRKPG